MSLWKDAEERLTPEARRVLDELIGDLRRQTILSADRRAVGNEITVRDVIEALGDEIRPDSRGDRRRSRYLAVLTLYAVTGLLVIVIGVATNYLSSSGQLERSSWIVILTGTSVIAAAVGLLFTFRLRLVRSEISLIQGRRSSRSANKLLDEWFEIESSIRLAAARRMGSSASEKPVAQLAADLASAGFLSKEDAIDVEEVGRYRNSVAHGGEFDDLQPQLEKASRVRAKVARLD